MLKGITWTDYFTAAAILAGAWYLVIGLIYYRRELRDLLRGKTKIPFTTRSKKMMEEPDDNEEALPGSSFEELENTVTDIRHSILEEAGKEANKAALLRQLQNRLANYGGLRQPAFRIALNNFIIQHAENICGVSFSEEELEAAWEELPR